MQSIMLAILLSAGIISLPQPVLAAPAMAHAECRVVGKVLAVTKRTVERDAGWAKSWGISRTTDYRDVMMAVTSSELHQDIGFNNCAEKTGTHTFQLHDDWQNWLQRWQACDCITALNRFGGDEFRIGDWLCDIEETQASDCAPD